MMLAITFDANAMQVREKQDTCQGNSRERQQSLHLFSVLLNKLTPYLYIYMLGVQFLDLEPVITVFFHCRVVANMAHNAMVMS